MALLNNCGCGPRCTCTLAAIVASAILGVLTAFLQITGVITITTVFLWVVLGVAVVYLGGLALVRQSQEVCGCLCTALNTLLAGILGSIALALILLAVGITATSITSAILVGLLLFFFSLTFTSLACLIRCRQSCGT